MPFHTQFDIIGTIGVILLIGIMKKNAIMMIDFAVRAERVRGLPPADAIYEACSPADLDDHHGVRPRRHGGAVTSVHGTSRTWPIWPTMSAYESKPDI